MAKTFTGLKLQGEIGKFGNIEISDTSGYAMFPDGKVLSGSEAGSLLLWQDSLVKCEFDRQGGKPCHKGMVEVVFLSGHDVITGGQDGVIRVWDFTTIDTAETEDTSVPIDLAMKFKLRIAKGASIKSMHRVGAGYIVVDQNGGLWRVDLDNKTVQLIQRYHAGAVRAAAFSPNAPLFVTGGDDGYVRLWNIQDRSLIGELRFEAPVTRIVWVNLEADRDGITLYVGFADGCFRVLLCSAKGLVLKQALKPHTAAVRDIVVATITNIVATTGDDGAIFFFRVESSLVPIGFVYVNGRKPRTKEEITQAAISGVPLTDDREYARGLKIRWSSNVVSVDLSDGTIVSLTAPTGIPDPTGESFYIDMPMETMSGAPPDETVSAILQLDDVEIKGKKDGKVVSPTFSRQLHSGSVTTLATSADQQWLLTASDNGEVFLFQQQSQTVKTRPIERVDLRVVDVPSVSDIKSGDYSIEEEKQKSELDRRIKAADEKKLLKRQQIESLRQKYSSLVQQNLKAPAHKRLSADDFHIDPFLYDLLKEQSDKIVQDASYATMWAAEKSRVSLQKVKRRLIRLMTDESFTVRAINSDTKVSSFRISAVGGSTETADSDATSATQLMDAQDDEAKTHQSESVTGEPEVAPSPRTGRSQVRRTMRFGRQSPMKKIVHTADEHTQMQRKRDERKRAIQELKPPANYSDPADLAAIENARATIGDYKLKDDPTYIAPEEDRMNASKKRRQLMAVQTAVGDLKASFNRKLKNLRELKARLLVTIAETNRELGEIALTIGAAPTDELVIRVAKDDVSAPLDLREKIDIALPAPEAVSFAEQVAAAARRRLEAQTGKQKQAAQPARRGAAVKRVQPQQTKKKVAEKAKPSDIEVIEHDQVRLQLEFKRKALLANIRGGIERFDKMVAELAQEKVHVHAEVVLAELRFLMMLREFKLLAKLELKDHELNDKLRQRRHDMDAIDVEVAAQQKRLKDAEHELEDREKALKKLAKRFDGIVEQFPKAHKELWTIYNYNIRQDTKMDEADDVEVDFATFDVEQVKKMFEAQAIQKQSDACPADCDQTVFEKVLDLREERMDIIERNSGALAMKDQIQKQCDSILFKRKGLESQFNQIKAEFEEFQHEKQRRLNELNFSLSLQFHQIRYLESREVVVGESRAPQTVKSMPTDLSQALVFLNSGLDKLKQQEQNLKNHRQTLYNLWRTNVSHQNEDEKARADLMKKIADGVGKLAEIQKLKFGQPVDLVMLEQLRVNRDTDADADALRLQIAQVEKMQDTEMQAIIDQTNQATEELTREVQRNTALLDALAGFTEQQRDIESVLQNSRTTQTAEKLSQDPGLANPDELLAQVDANNQLIDKLTEEISLLKRK
jgi:WD40 repeat protein